MHRSGTSLVAKLLGEAGVHLGSPSGLLPANEHDNPAGYYEHRAVFEINEAILATLGGSWGHPPQFKKGWHKDKKLDRLRASAEGIANSLGENAVWGVKDPRFCLTLPFWMEIVPDAQIVICLRHPFEVAQSFAARIGSFMSRTEAIEVWTAYHRQLLSDLGGRDAVVTHYSSYLYRPEDELARVLELLGIQPEGSLDFAAQGVDKSLAHGFSHGAGSSELLTDECLSLYEELAGRAGPVYHRHLTDGTFQKWLVQDSYRKALRKIEKLEGLYLDRTHEVEQLKRELSLYRGPLPLAMARKVLRKLRGMRKNAPSS